MKYHKQTNLNFTGFTLIEVLVTLVILSIGLLGMAGIQIQGLRGTTSSTVRSQATILANDIADRIRMNFDGLNVAGNPQNSDYSNVVITSNNGNPTLSCATAPPTCSVTPGTSSSAVTACNTTEMAQFDIFEFACGPWDGNAAGNGGIQNLLPNGSALIFCGTDAANPLDPCPQGSEVTISISWTEHNTANGAANGNLQIKNLSMVIIP